MVFGKVKMTLHNFKEGIFDALNYRIHLSKYEATRSYRWGTRFIRTTREAPQGGLGWLRNILYGRVYFNVIQGLIPTLIFLYTFDYGVFEWIYRFLFLIFVFLIILIIINILLLLKGGGGKVGESGRPVFLFTPFNVHTVAFLVVGFILLFVVFSWPSPNYKEIINIVVKRYAQNIPYYGEWIVDNFSMLWSILIALSCIAIFFTMSTSPPGRAWVMTALEVILLLIIGPPMVGALTRVSGVVKVYDLREMCKNPLFAMIRREECRVVMEGVRPTERVRYTPISGKVSIRIDPENLQSFVVNHTYVLPFSVSNEFDVPIQVQVAGLLQSGVENYRFIVNGDECAIGSDSWCTIPENSEREFLVKFNQKTAEFDVGLFIKCPVRLETSRAMGCDCGRGEDEDVVGCGNDEVCVYVYEDCCKCLSWNKATESRKNFFYPGARVRFKGYFWQTKSYEVKRSKLPTARVHELLKRITGMVYKPTGWEQDNLRISVLLFPSVYDFSLYSGEKPTLIFHVKNVKSGELYVDYIAIEVGKRDFGPEVLIEKCDNADLEAVETPYTVKYRIEPSITVISKDEEIYIPCTLSIREELVETPPHKTTVYFNVFLNYTYTKSYLTDAILVYVLA